MLDLDNVAVHDNIWRIKTLLPICTHTMQMKPQTPSNRYIRNHPATGTWKVLLVTQFLFWYLHTPRQRVNKSHTTKKRGWRLAFSVSSNWRFLAIYESQHITVLPIVKHIGCSQGTVQQDPSHLHNSKNAYILTIWHIYTMSAVHKSN
jgi:hypothetical protein